MCGIVGYTGYKDATPILLDGLERLVYRGYDSAGVAIHREGDFRIRKIAGPVENLIARTAGEDGFGASGIGHTRWATHGMPTEENAHPHTDCEGRLALVHNGVVENADVLRRELRAVGHRFRTPTDTEVLAHLIEAEDPACSLEARVRSALRRVEGRYAIAVVAVDEPGRIVVARRGSPVLLGLGTGEFFVASDATAVRGYTDSVVYLQDGDMAVVTADDYRVTNGTAESVHREVTRLEWGEDAVDLEQFDRYMLKEIYEQPEAIRRTLRSSFAEGDGGALLRQLGFGQNGTSGLERIEIVACGTSWHAGIIGRYILEEIAGVPVQVEYASEHRYKSRLPMPGTLTVAISQSGETADTLEAIRMSREEGSRILGIVNVKESSIARMCHAVAYLDAGPEIGVASTKAFTCQVIALLRLGMLLGNARGTLPADRRRAMEREMLRLPEIVGAALEIDDATRVLAEHFVNAQGFLYLGRGINFPVALEGALKMKEVSYIYAEGYPAAEMKHGPIALVDENTPVIFVVPRDGLYRKVLANIEEVKARGGRVIAICGEVDDELAGLADHLLHVPCSPNSLLSPLSTVVPLQLLAYHVAVLRGCNVDRPRNLAKSVTVE